MMYDNDILYSKPMDISIEEELQFRSDGTTVWIDHLGDTIGRFGRFGIDVHNTWKAQLAGASQCLACTHHETNEDDWYRFVSMMHEFHAVVVPADIKPLRFRVTVVNINA